MFSGNNLAYNHNNKRMKNRFKKWLYKKAFKIVANKIKDGTRLTDRDLFICGWKQKGHSFYEPNIKDRDKITIEFEHHYYRVWHSDKKTFIALETSEEWLQMYLFLMDKHQDFDNPMELIARRTSI